jgi:hypothetical protein
MKDPLDARLHADGAAFRCEHGGDSLRPRRRLLAPLAAAAAVAAVAVGAAALVGPPATTQPTPAGTGACASGFVVLSSGTGDPFIADGEELALYRWSVQDGRLEPRKIPAPGVQGDAALSPDGTRLLYAAALDEPATSSFAGRPELYVADADGGSPRQLLEQENWDSDPHWSPDGSMIAFVRRPAGAAEGGPSEVWVMQSDGGDARRLTSGQDDSRPAWSPDGRGLVFVRTGNEQQRAMKMASTLATVAVTGGEAQAVREGFTVGPGDPAWSPDGARLAYSYIDYTGGGFSRVAVLDTTSGRTTSTPEGNDSPGWTRDDLLLTRQVASGDLISLVERESADGPAVREQRFSQPALTFNLSISSCGAPADEEPAPLARGSYKLSYNGPALIDGGGPDPQAQAAEKIRVCLELPGVQIVSESVLLPPVYRLQIDDSDQQAAFERCVEGVDGFQLIDTTTEQTFTIRPGNVQDVQAYADAMTGCLNLPTVGATSISDQPPLSYVAYAAGPAVAELDRCLEDVPGAAVEVQQGAPGNPLGLQEFIDRCVGREDAEPAQDGYVGLTEQQLQDSPPDQENPARIVGRDRVCLDRTADRRPERVNVIIDDSRVVWAGHF